MKWIATKRGFRNDRIVEIGDEFESDDFSGKWAVKKEEFTPEMEKTEEKLIEEAKEGLQGKKKSKKKSKKK